MPWLTRLAESPAVRAALQALAIALVGALVGPPLGVPDALQLPGLVQSALW